MNVVNQNSLHIIQIELLGIIGHINAAELQQLHEDTKRSIIQQVCF